MDLTNLHYIGYAHLLFSILLLPTTIICLLDIRCKLSDIMLERVLNRPWYLRTDVGHLMMAFFAIMSLAIWAGFVCFAGNGP
jgi:hypothetical protein